MKVSSEIVFCVLVSGATLATLAYCDFGPHHEEISYLPSGAREPSAPAEATATPEVTGLARAPFAMDGSQALPGGQVGTICAPGAHDQPDSQPAPVSEKAACLERTSGENSTHAVP
jgi:hypothetical protein